MSPRRPVPPHSLTALVVDDDELIRRGVARMLGRAGYRVRVAASGSEALSILRSAPIHAVVSDIRMPEMSGLDLALEISRIWPWLHIVLMSGYESPAALASDPHLSSLPFIRKPFKVDQLLELLSLRAHRASTRTRARQPPPKPRPDA